MDPHSALLHLYAHVGRRGTTAPGGRPHAQTAPPQLDQRQGARPANQELHHRLERRQGHRSSRRRSCSWYVHARVTHNYADYFMLTRLYLWAMKGKKGRT